MQTVAARGRSTQPRRNQPEEWAQRRTTLLSEQMSWVLRFCAEHGGDIRTRDLLEPGSPNVERTSLSRTLRRLRRRGLVRLFMRTLEPGETRQRKYVQRVVLTDAGREAVHSVDQESDGNAAV